MFPISSTIVMIKVLVCLNDEHPVVFSLSDQVLLGQVLRFLPHHISVKVNGI